jgi:hypothetical protein
MAIPENQLETWSRQDAITSALGMYERIRIRVAPEMKLPSKWCGSVVIFLRNAFATSIILFNNTPHASPRCAPWGVTFWAAR